MPCAGVQPYQGIKPSTMNPFRRSGNKRRDTAADDALTDMEKAAQEAAPKRSKHHDHHGNVKPKRNVRKGKTRKR